jgi:HK97 family phage major capsid protein
MTPEKTIALAGEIGKKTARMAELIAKDEAGKCSRREAAEFDRLAGEIKELRKQLPPDDGRQFQPGVRSSREEHEAELLAPGDSLREWVAAGGGGFDSIGTGQDAFSSASFGKVVRAAISGDRSKLNDAESRAMAEGVNSAGGYMLGPELSSDIVDLARASSVVFQAGARTLPMSTSTAWIPRLAAGAEANRKAENDPVVNSDQTWERVTLTAKTVVAQLILSTELAEDVEGTEADAVIRGDVSKALALALDLAALEADGTDPASPLGIVATSGVNTIAMSGADGSAPASFDEIVRADFAVRQANGNPATAAVMHPRDGESYALLKDSTQQPLRRPTAIESLPFLTTSQISVTRTTGTSTDTSHAYVGDFATVIVGVRPSLNVRLVTLNERYSDRLQIGILAWLRADVALRRPEHMTVITGVTPHA